MKRSKIVLALLVSFAASAAVSAPAFAKGGGGGGWPVSHTMANLAADKQASACQSNANKCIGFGTTYYGQYTPNALASSHTVPGGNS